MSLKQSFIRRCVARLVRCSLFVAPVLIEPFEKHFHLVMAVGQRSKVLDKVLLTVSNRKKSCYLGDVRLHILFGILFEKLVHLVIIGILPDTGRKCSSLHLQLARKAINQRFVNKLVRPSANPARLVLRFVKSISIEVEQFLVKIVRERLEPLVGNGQQKRIYWSQILACSSESQYQLEPKILSLCRCFADREKKRDLVKIEPVKLSGITAALMSIHNFGLKPKLSKLCQLILMCRNLFSEMCVSHRKQLCHVAGIRQQVGTLVGDWDNVFHRVRLNVAEKLTSKNFPTNAKVEARGE